MTTPGNHRWQVVVLLATSMVACREGTAAPDIAATRNPAPAPAPESIPADELIAFIATKALYPIPFETAAQRFSHLVELHKVTPTPMDTVLVGSRPA